MMANAKQGTATKAVQRPSKKVRTVSKGLKSEIMIFLEKGLKKGEKGLAYLEKEIHKLIEKQSKNAHQAKEKLQAVAHTAKRKVSRTKER